MPEARESAALVRSDDHEVRTALGGRERHGVSGATEAADQLERELLPAGEQRRRAASSRESDVAGSEWSWPIGIVPLVCFATSNCGQTTCSAVSSTPPGRASSEDHSTAASDVSAWSIATIARIDARFAHQASIGAALRTTSTGLSPDCAMRSAVLVDGPATARVSGEEERFEVAPGDSLFANRLGRGDELDVQSAEPRTALVWVALRETASGCSATSSPRTAPRTGFRCPR